MPKIIGVKCVFLEKDKRIKIRKKTIKISKKSPELKLISLKKPAKKSKRETPLAVIKVKLIVSII